MESKTPTQTKTLNPTGDFIHKPSLRTILPHPPQPFLNLHTVEQKGMEHGQSSEQSREVRNKHAQWGGASCWKQESPRRVHTPAPRRSTTWKCERLNARFVTRAILSHQRIVLNISATRCSQQSIIPKYRQQFSQLCTGTSQHFPHHKSRFCFALHAKTK